MNDEAKLIKGLAERDRHFIQLFIKKYQNTIFRICLGFVHNKQDAEELTQDVLVEVIKNIGKFKGNSLLKTWIYRICYTRSLNKIKKDKWKKWMKSLDDVLGLNEPKEDSADALQEVELDERRTVLHQAIDQLPGQQKVAFVLNKYEQMPYKDVAETMGLSVSSVESLLFRAKQNVKKYLEKNFKSLFQT